MSMPLDVLRSSLLARLSPAVLGSTRECKLCRHPAHYFDGVDFNKACDTPGLSRTGVSVDYFRCQRCELLFTDFFDAWSKEDFSTYIYNAQYVDVDPEYVSIRPLRAAEELVPSLAGMEHLRILDYGSGSGVFERALRARGFADVHSFDPFSQPVRPESCFDIITCMDVIEHSPDPRALFDDILGFLAEGGCVLVGQTLQPADIETQRGGWWYMAPRNGHATTYSCETMRLYAADNGLHFADFGDLFALTGASPSDASDTIIARRRPQIRRIALAAPVPEDVVNAAWHPAEITPYGAFRWTRSAEVRLGVHHTPRGYLRVVVGHMAVRSPDFLARSRIRVGDHDAPLTVHEGDLFAVFDLPTEAVREIDLVTPPPYSEAAAGIGTDLRPVGIGISCVPPA